MYKPLFLILLLAFGLFAQTTLSGNIGGMTFGPEGSPYVVNENITVQKGKATIIKAGCVFLFREATGITVDGGFVVSGTEEKPVVFTTLNTDTTYTKTGQLPNPFDWNGIQISKDAGKVKISFFMISYSVFGIKSLKNDIHLSHGIFQQNGQEHYTLQNNIMPVVEAVPYFYSLDLQAASTPFSVTVREITIPVLLGTAGILSGAGAAYFYARKKAIHGEYGETTAQIDYNRIRDNESQALTRLVFCSTVSALCITSASVLFIVGTIKGKSAKNRSLHVGVGSESISISVSTCWRIPWK